MSIKVISNAAKREIILGEPAVLTMTTVEELVQSLGEDLVVQQIKAQLKVSFRAVIRRKLEEVDDNNEFALTNDAILADDYSDWKPSLRVTKTAEEKVKDILGNLSPEVREALLAQYRNA